MVEVTTLDLVIIGLYLLFMLLVGVWFVKRIKNTDDYYVAGRTLGPVVLAATVCATIIGGSAMMGRAGIAYTTGFMAIATALPYTGHVYLLRLRRAYSAGGGEVPHRVHPQPVRVPLRKAG